MTSPAPPTPAPSGSHGPAAGHRRQLDDAAIAEPSLLPGWTRGHLLAHLARNADALVNVLSPRRSHVPSASPRRGHRARRRRPVAEH